MKRLSVLNSRCSNRRRQFNNRRRRFAVALLLSPFLLNACAIKQAPTTEESLYKVAATVTLRADDKRARRFSVVWERFAGRDEVLILDAAGKARGKLRIDDDGAVLQTAAKTVRKKSADLIVQELFGFSFPARALRYWLTAESDPTMSTRELIYPGGEMRKISQREARVFFEDYKNHPGDNGDKKLPSTIRIKTPQGEAVVTVRQWFKLPPG